MSIMSSEFFDIERMAVANAQDPREFRDFIQELINEGTVRGSVITDGAGREILVLEEDETFSDAISRLLERLRKARGSG